MNVIKQRQLSNGNKLTPKTDFVCGVYGNTTTEDVSIYNIDGTLKKAIKRWRHGETISVGKGQYISFNNKEVDGINTYVLQLNNKFDDSQINEVVIDSTDNGYNDYYKTKSISTFLGQCFLSLGDEDRYIFLNSTDAIYGQSGGNYATTLFNIDKWEVVGIAQNSDSVDDGLKYDFTYDGVDRVYFIFKNTIRFITIGSTGQTSWGELLDNTGTVVSATRIYGISASKIGSVERIVYRTLDNKVKVILLSDNTLGESITIGTNGTVAMIPAGDTISDITQSQSIVVSTDTGTLIRKRTNQSQITLSTNSMEKVLKVLHFKHTPNVESELWLVMADLSTNSYKTRKYKVDWTAGYGSAGVVSQVLLGDIPKPGIEILNDINIQNTCNTYNIGKFYDYGLQKKWDLR